jgi:hypothetical protein
MAIDGWCYYKGTLIRNNIREENVYTLKSLSENDLICQQKSKYRTGKH